MFVISIIRHTSAGTIAVSALSSETALREIGLAVVGRRLQEHEFAPLGDPLLTDAGPAAELGPLQHEMRPSKLLLLLRLPRRLLDGHAGLSQCPATILAKSRRLKARLALGFCVVAEDRRYLR